MKPMYLRISGTKIYHSNEKNSINETCYQLDPQLELKENLENFKKENSSSLDIIVITNPSENLLKKNIFIYNDKQYDFTTELEDVFHLPVVNISDVEHSDLVTAAEREIEYSTWHLDYSGIDHEKRQYGQESMQTIGNGFYGLRGTYFEAKANDDNYPATYVAGVFNQLATPINGRNVINEDLVNLPNSQYLTFSIDNGKPFKIDENVIEESLRSLDLRTGVLTITMLVKLLDGKELKIVEKKVADLKNYHDYYLEYSVQPINFSGQIKIITETDASVVNSNVERYRNLANKHLSTDKITNEANQMLLLAHTTQSKIKLAIKTDFKYPDIKHVVYQENNQPEIAQQSIEFPATESDIYTVEKAVSIFTSLETKDDVEAVATKHQFLPSFVAAIKASKDAWHAIWNKENVVITGDITAQKLVHLNSFQMMIAAQDDANKDLDTSVGSRGLTGEGYRGHIFWDELFDMNFYILHYPELVKDLLMYRYNRLGAAIDYASDDHHNGAMFPWQSGMYGDEQSQEVHLNPITNKWDPDNSRKQRHVSLAVAYNVLNYYNFTQDEVFMEKYGLEMLLNITKFWIDMADFDENTGKYTISNVMGPDEFHEGYPGQHDDGLKNNAYTNIMVSWLFKKVMELIKHEDSSVIADNFKRTHFTADNEKALDSIRHNLKLDFKDDILGQFEGYFDLQELDFDKYRQKYGNISRMDRILKAHDDTPDNYQVAKQADTLMALFNIRESEFLDIMQDLGYPIANPHKFISDNIKYYLARTTHGSTLSRIVYSMLVLKVNDTDLAWKLFYEALTSDYYDIQGGTTAEGIHLGVMGATLTVVTSYFAGVDYRGDELQINPNVPKQWEEIDFNMTFKHINFYFQITGETCTIKADHDTEVNFMGKRLPLTADQVIELTY